MLMIVLPLFFNNDYNYKWNKLSCLCPCRAVRGAVGDGDANSPEVAGLRGGCSPLFRFCLLCHIDHLHPSHHGGTLGFSARTAFTLVRLPQELSWQLSGKCFATSLPSVYMYCPFVAGWWFCLSVPQGGVSEQVLQRFRLQAEPFLLLISDKCTGCYMINQNSELYCQTVLNHILERKSWKDSNFTH